MCFPLLHNHLISSDSGKRSCTIMWGFQDQHESHQSQYELCHAVNSCFPLVPGFQKGDSSDNRAELRFQCVAAVLTTRLWWQQPSINLSVKVMLTDKVTVLRLSWTFQVTATKSSFSTIMRPNGKLFGSTRITQFSLKTANFGPKGNKFAAMSAELLFRYWTI